MGRKNDAIVPLFKDKEHFADLFNGTVYDKLYPVITLVFYAGDDWDGATDLYGMLELEDMADSDVLKKYIPNYHINLVNPNYMEDLNIFKSDLQIIFGMLQCKKDKIALRGYIDKNRDYFMSVNHKTAYAISAMLNSDRLFRELEDKEGDENMCQAIEDIYSEGIDVGLEKGREEGREETIRTTVSLLKDICSAEEIVDKLVTHFKFTEDKARAFL